MASTRSRVRPKYKTKYRVQNWSAYDRALVRRGDLTIWFTPESIDAWEPRSTGRRGGQQKYSDLAIETALTLRLVFNLPLRQTEGLLNSILRLMGLEIQAPDHTTLSRRCRKLQILPSARPPGGEIHLVVDSTGLKIVGQGEWAAAKHGGQGKRGWRKLHLGVDEAGVIVAVELTENTTDDASMVPNLVGQVEGDIVRFTGDAAYDTRAVYEAAQSRGAVVVVPPTRQAVAARRTRVPCQSRDSTIMQVRAVGLRQWKKESDYHLQGRVENTFFRYKRIFGGALRARDGDAQDVEARMACTILNHMAGLGMPESRAIAE